MRLLTIAIALVLVTAGCGGSDSSTTSAGDDTSGRGESADIGDLLNPTGAGSTGPVITIELPDALSQFIDDLERAFADADTPFLINHLHPVVIDQYGLETCRSSITALTSSVFIVNPTAYTELVNWTLELDGIETLVPDVVEVEYLTGQGAERTFHVGEIGGEFFYFFDCGDPLDTPGGPSVQES